MTVTAEAQKVEDDLAALAGPRGLPGSRFTSDASATFEAIDARLLDLAVPTEEWDVLYRIRLQLEREQIAGSKPGAFPGQRSA